MQQRKVDLIGAMAVRGMNAGLDIRAVVIKHVEDEVALMVVRADVPSVDRNMIGKRCTGYDSFLHAPIPGRMSGVESTDTGLEFLAVAAGMHDIADIVMTEYGQRRGRVADDVVGFPQRFRPKKIV